MTAAGEYASEWIIYTSRSGYTAEIAEIIWRTGATVAVLIDNMPDGPEPSPLGRVVSTRDLDPALPALPTAVAMNTPGHRFNVVDEAMALGFSQFPTLVDPTSVVARTARLDDGTIVNGQAIIAANSYLGRFVHVNRSASIGHDAVIHDFVSLGPACVLAGFVTVGRGAFIGASAVVAPKVRIGANATVGVGAVVVRDVPERAVVVGNPARVLREAELGYDGVAVPDDSITR
jgi:sugar O-acyltransferase (sialic acid O-acetyltransferase NeuD family)